VLVVAYEKYDSSTAAPAGIYIQNCSLSYMQCNVPVQISSDSKAISPSVVVDKAGVIRVFYATPTGTPGSAWGDIYVTKSTNMGSSFTTQVLVAASTSATTINSFPRAAIDSVNHTIALVWNRLGVIRALALNITDFDTNSTLFYTNVVTLDPSTGAASCITGPLPPVLPIAMFLSHEIV